MRGKDTGEMLTQAAGVELLLCSCAVIRRSVASSLVVVGAMRQIMIRTAASNTVCMPCFSANRDMIPGPV